MPDAVRNPGELILDSGFHRNDHVDNYCCRSNSYANHGG
jgi:hypothetical protein